jgi:hypothetical protein
MIFTSIRLVEDFSWNRKNAPHSTCTIPSVSTIKKCKHLLFYFLFLAPNHSPSPMRRLSRINWFPILITILFCGQLQAQPIVNSFSPATGTIGTTVVITGTNFSNTPSGNIVFFGAVKANVTAATTTSITVTVPQGATYEPISVTVNGLTAFSALPFNVTFSNGGDINPGSFENRVDFLTDLHPNSVAVSDLDGDGKPDLATANNYASGNVSSISVLRNISIPGSISFAPKQDFSNAATTYAIAAGDLDGDGKHELVFTNNMNSGVSVLRNTSGPGSISFAPKIDYTSGSNPFGVVIGNIDDDGKPDIITLNSTSQTIAVFRNTSTTGAISFAPKVEFSTQLFPQSVAIGDIDMDGKSDIIVTNKLSNSFSVFRNTSTAGTISFATRADIPCGSGNEPYGLTSADLDGDLKPDLAVVIVNNAGSAAQLFRNTSTPGAISFSFATSLSGGPNTTSYHVAAGDINGDAKPDIAFTTDDSFDKINVFQNLSTPGTISFGTANVFAAILGPYAVGIWDVDGDSKPEISTSQFIGDNISICKNRSGAATVTSFTPAAAAPGATVTITGFNFTGATAVSFGGVPAASFSVVNATTISAVVGTGASGNVAVTNAIGTGTLAGFILAVPPTISSFSPTSAGAGATVTITGTNFTGITAVSFGGVPAQGFTVVNATTITAVVATGASGNVEVTNPYGTASLAGFTYNLPAPTITSFSPAFSGSGTTIQISGTNFTGVTAVSFGGVPATSFTVISATTIGAVVGTGASGSVAVTTPGGTATLPGFTYMPPPTISSFTPTSAATGTTVTITGNNFSGATAVSFGAVPASSFTVVNATTITALMGAGASGNVVVTTLYGTASLAGFTYLPPPTITSFSPTSGAPGTVVTISGANLGSVTAVSFSGTDASSFTIVNSTTITAVTGIGGSGFIYLQSPNGPGSSSGSFTFVYPPPTITSFTPTSGTTGTEITITGTNFTSVPLVGVTFGGVQANPVVVQSATSLKATVGAGATGNVIITTNGGTASLPGFTYVQPPPTILSVSPGEAAPGAAINIVGNHFTGATSVTFGGVAASSFIVNSNTSITAIVGQGATGTVAVTSPGGTGSYPTFTFAALKVNSFSPAVGSAGTVVTITGSGFDAPFIGVRFGGVQATSVTVNSPTQITATVGAGASGYVEVTSIGSLRAGKPGFTYATPNTVINSVSPSIAASGTAVTITGYNFTGATAVSFGGVAATSFTVNSQTSITAIVGNGASGTVSVTSPAGTATFNGFIYTQAPFVTTFSPLSGHAGMPITITGNNFNAVAANNVVHFGAVRAKVITASATSLTVAVPFGATYDYIAITNMSNNLTGYSSKRFNTTFLALSALGPGSFAARIDSAAGPKPWHVSVCDIDTNGKPDVAVARDYFNNSTHRNVSIFRNTGSPATISFAPQQLLTNNNVPASTSFTDFDGDGRQDIVLANAVDGAGVSVYRNTSTNGTIAFGNELILQNGLGPFFSAAGDFDGDGKPDILVAGPSAAIQIRKNKSVNGNISFDPAVNIPGSGNYFSVADIDGDGKPDIIASYYGPGPNDGQVRVYRNTSTEGTFSFAPGVTYFNMGTGTGNNFVGDFDGDGLPDIIVPNEYTRTIAVLRNNSVAGTINLEPKVVYFSDLGPKFVSMADFDGNGKPDVVVANVYASNVSVFSNTSTNGSISLGQRFDYATGNGPNAVAVGDIDVDGKPDIISANHTSGTVSFLRNQIEAYSILSFTPDNGTDGTVVTITGTNLSGVTAISFGGVPAQSFTINSPTSITAIVGAGATGNLSVTTPGGILVPGIFTYHTVTSVGNPIINSRDLTISPNPGNNFVRIKHPAVAERAEIRFVDMMGRVVKQIIPGRNSKETPATVADLARGVYCIMWIDKKKILTQTFIVQ